METMARRRYSVGALLLRSGVVALALLISACSLPIALGPIATLPPAIPPSPLIFGTNMGLFTANDQIITSPATQQLLKGNGVAIMRIPSRFTLSDAAELAALRAVKTIGAAPLLILHGATDANALADDLHLLGLIQSVFSDGPVYIEFGNEEDLAGVDVARYTDAWNQVVPRLKAQAPTYRFIGPVTYTYNPDYVAAFDKHANPRPDFNSWHEYVCNPSSTDAYCIEHISNWNSHIQQTNEAVKKAIGATLPFMITEWNLDPQQDPRYTNAAFIQPWTEKALQTLEANSVNGLFAAMQYCATNNEGFNLIDGQNSLTPQGVVFFRSLAALRATPTPTRQP